MNPEIPSQESGEGSSGIPEGRETARDRIRKILISKPSRSKKVKPFFVHAAEVVSEAKVSILKKMLVPVAREHSLILRFTVLPKTMKKFHQTLYRRMAAASEKILGRFFAKEKYHDEHSEIRESQDGESYNDGELTIDAIKRRKFYKYCKMIESGEIGRLKGTVEVRKLSGIKSSYLFSTKANLWELYTLLESFRSVEAKDIQRLTDGLQEYIRVSDEWITLREKKPLTVDLEILSYVECSKPEMESRLISETDDEL